MTIPILPKVLMIPFLCADKNKRHSLMTSPFLQTHRIDQVNSSRGKEKQHLYKKLTVIRRKNHYQLFSICAHEWCVQTKNLSCRRKIFNHNKHHLATSIKIETKLTKNNIWGRFRVCLSGEECKELTSN